jgi:hypothetical protein
MTVHMAVKRNKTRTNFYLELHSCILHIRRCNGTGRPSKRHSDRRTHPLCDNHLQRENQLIKHHHRANAGNPPI